MNDNVKYRISVVVAMYNPIPEKLWLTLNSIIYQEKVELEIVITDDGSKNNLFNDINEYMRKNDFSNYKLLFHKHNKGTVLNCYDGVNQASGDYIKLISPGDFLASKDILYHWVDHMVNSNLGWSFGEAVYYINDGIYKAVSRKTHPQNIHPYVKHNQAKCRWNYLVHDDVVLGAATISTRDLLLQYFQQILNKVKYMEDNIFRIMMFDGVMADYYPNNVIFYECNTGVSTSGDPKWGRLLYDDWVATNEIMMSNTYKVDAVQAKLRKKMMKVYSNNNKVRIIAKLTASGWLIFKLKNKFNPRLSNTNCDVNLCLK